MYQVDDPVDGALKALRSERWTENSHGTKLKEMLMKEYRPHTPPSRPTRRHALIATLAVLVIGGGTFAATGGVEKLRKWLVKVEINGQVHEFETGEDGTGTFTIETEDGGQAEVRMQVASSPEEGDMTNIEIRMENASSEEVGEVVMKRRALRCGEQPVLGGTYTLEDLGDTEPLSEHEADGIVRRFYAVPNAEDEGEGFKIFLATTDADDNTVVHLLAAPPVALPEDAGDLNVDLDEEGRLSIRIATADGREMVMELQTKITVSEVEISAQDPISVTTQGGEITVTVEAEEIEEDE